MKFAYADPPYIGQAKRHYGNHPDYKGEVDYKVLINSLVIEYPDGWALSAHSPSLKTLLNLCPENVRVAAWVKPWSVWKDKNIAYAWEPVIFSGGRKRKWRESRTALDWVSANAVMNRKNDPNKTKGTKPDKFCFWLFNLLNVKKEDTFTDLFPGSGAVSEFLSIYIGRTNLESEGSSKP